MPDEPVICEHCGEPLYTAYGSSERKFHEPSDSIHCPPQVKAAYQLERIAEFLKLLVGAVLAKS